MEGVLLVSSTGFAPGSIYGSTFFLGTMFPTAFTEFWNIGGLPKFDFGSS